MWEKSRDVAQQISKDIEKANDKLKQIIEEYSDDRGGELLGDLQKIKEELINLKEKAAGELIVQFVGATGSGKSSLINCLLRDDRLPVDELECTISSIRVCTTPGSKWSVKVNGKELEKGDDKQHVKWLLNETGDEAAKEQQKCLEITKESVVEFFWPNYLCTTLPDNVVLVDSPGYMENPLSSEVVTASGKKADIIVAVMRMGVPTPQPVSSAYTEFETFVITRKINHMYKPILLIVFLV